MIKHPCTQYGEKMFAQIRSGILPSLYCLNDLDFKSAKKKLKACRNSFDKCKKPIDCKEERYLNDLYVLNSYLSFFESYCETWRLILNQEFTESWKKLQDSIDLIRVLKKFSSIHLDFFEHQLPELEKAYPYNTFFSIGAVVKKSECSICGKDINSLECTHRKGKLYGGKMAVGIVKNIEVDHVSIVSSPADKRCVITFTNNHPVFELVGNLADSIKNGIFSIFDLNGIKISEVKRKNPDYMLQGRNERCACGSGKKFKKCCISKEYIDGIHADIAIKQVRSEEQTKDVICQYLTG